MRSGLGNSCTGACCGLGGSRGGGGSEPGAREKIPRGRE